MVYGNDIDLQHGMVSDLNYQSHARAANAMRPLKRDILGLNDNMSDLYPV